MMARLGNPVEVLKLLDRSNCKKCGCPTCFAFAVEVINGTRRLGECPGIKEEILNESEVTAQSGKTIEQNARDALDELKKRVAGIDLKAAAERIGAPFSGDRLTLRILGKNFSVAASGDIITDIHVNPWIVRPVFSYILDGEGIAPSGEWVSFRDLEGGKIRYPLFQQRCEKPCKALADVNPDFFDSLIRLFNGRQVENHYESDVSLVLHPLPKVPLLICYWKTDGELASDLNIFFDATSPRNISVETIFGLAAGLVAMFEKIARRHGAEIA